MAKSDKLDIAVEGLKKIANYSTHDVYLSHEAKNFREQARTSLRAIGIEEPWW